MRDTAVPREREIRADFAEHFRMPMAMPFRFLNMLFCHYGSAWAMKSCAVNQSGLKCLQLLTGDDVVVNIDNHDAIPFNRIDR